jgi:hypothetical protein
LFKLGIEYHRLSQPVITQLMTERYSVKHRVGVELISTRSTQGGVKLRPYANFQKGD